LTSPAGSSSSTGFFFFFSFSSYCYIFKPAASICYPSLLVQPGYFFVQASSLSLSPAFSATRAISASF
jgi:hypothetical protein